MLEQIISDRLIQMFKDYAASKRNDVARSAETPALAALLLQKYGQGVIDAIAVINDTPRAADFIAKIIDEEVAQIDPLWRENNQKRWNARPANLAFSATPQFQEAVIANATTKLILTDPPHTVIDLQDVLVDRLNAGEPVHIDLAPLQKLSQKERARILTALLKELQALSINNSNEG